MELTRIFEFDSAHKLPWYQGKCSNLHGHTWSLEITVSGQINKNGIVIDFVDLKKIVNENVVEKLDHSYLNDIIENPTAENIIFWVGEQIKEKLELQNIKLSKIRLYETKNSYAEQDFR